MNLHTTIRAALSVLAVSALAACGGDDNHADKAEGWYTGKTSTGQSTAGVVLDNGEYWIIYSSEDPDSPIGGVIQGSSSAKDGKFTSEDGRDFNLQGEGVSELAIDGTYLPKSAIAGDLTYRGDPQQYRFTSTYENSYETPVTLAAIAGTYAGTGAILSGSEPTTVTVSPTGAISGSGDSGCRFTGSASPRGAVGIYNLTLTFLGGTCDQGTSTESGIATFSAESQTLMGATLNATRTGGTFYTGVKTSATR